MSRLIKEAGDGEGQPLWWIDLSGSQDVRTEPLASRRILIWMNQRRAFLSYSSEASHAVRNFATNSLREECRDVM